MRNPFELAPHMKGHPLTYRKLTPTEQKLVRKKFGTPLRCSFAWKNKTRNGKKHTGFYCYTHRTSSRCYSKPDGITIKEYSFVSSTG